MKKLRDILSSIIPVKIAGSLDTEVTSLCTDSRQAAPGAAFIAVKGTVTDGHSFIDAVIAAGAIAIVCAKLPVELVPGVTYIQVSDPAEVAGLMADAFFDYPSRHMVVTGITGTNGKTTTATLLYQLYTKLGHKCGLISTVQNHIGEQVEVATHTTPDAISVQRLLARMVEAGCSHVFMEVSSHAIHQHRIAGIRFQVGVFTNITHDHLDYHKTFDEYIRVKKNFFDNLPVNAFAITNIDDKRGLVMLQNTRAKKITCSLQMPADIKGKVLENSLTGIVMYLDGVEAHFRMIGTFNAYNVLSVYAAARALGAEKEEVLAVLSDLRGAPGRFETYTSPVKKVIGIVDYAHTPDALLNVLATVNQLRTNGQQLITIVGCGGDRDKTKRPVMAEVAATHSDKVILTSDNPRTENPETILDEMEAGLTLTHRRKTLRITSRRDAIKTACTLAGSGDIIMVAGKGHENYQEINGVKHHFDDREELMNAFELLNI